MSGWYFLKASDMLFYSRPGEANRLKPQTIVRIQVLFI